MQNRIKEVRKHFGLSQTEFGARLGVAQTTIGGYENGSRAVSDAIILSICREFGVSETWLRTGAGEMFAARSREAELGALIRSRLIDRPESFQSELIRTLLRFDPNGPEWAVLEKIVQVLKEEAKQEETKKDPEP